MEYTALHCLYQALHGTDPKCHVTCRMSGRGRKGKGRKPEHKERSQGDDRCEWLGSAAGRELATRLFRTEMSWKLLTANVSRQPSTSVNSGSRGESGGEGGGGGGLSGWTTCAFQSASCSDRQPHKSPRKLAARMSNGGTASKRTHVHEGLLYPRKHDGSSTAWTSKTHMIGSP